MKDVNKIVPSEIGGAKVICYTPIDHRHKFTGNCKQIVVESLMGPMARLAICQYKDDGDFYLFGCDGSWACQTDTCHPTLNEALRQAEFEYKGTLDTWIWMK